MNTGLYRYIHIEAYATSIISTVIASFHRWNMGRRMGRSTEDSPGGEHRRGVLRGMRRFSAATASIPHGDHGPSDELIDARRYVLSAAPIWRRAVYIFIFTPYDFIMANITGHNPY